MATKKTRKKKSAKKTVAAKIDLAYAREVIVCEAKAVSSLKKSLDAHFTAAARMILTHAEHGRGRVIGTGMGKAGIVAQKVIATMASTGTPALFMHPAEAVHGDLGMVAKNDILLAFSNSGRSDEILRLLPAVRREGAKIVAVTGHPDSPLGRFADVVLCIGRHQEPCPLRLAPSASTTAMLAMGDALALTVLKARGLTALDFARWHPAGALGRKLSRAEELMRTGKRLPLVGPKDPVGKAVDAMTRAQGGTAVVIGARGRLLGVFTDGDFRRLMVQDHALFNAAVSGHMTKNCRFARNDAMVGEVQELMAKFRINALPVVDAKKRVVGLLDIQDLVGG